MLLGEVAARGCPCPGAGVADKRSHGWRSEVSIERAKAWRAVASVRQRAWAAPSLIHARASSVSRMTRQQRRADRQRPHTLTGLPDMPDESLRGDVHSRHACGMLCVCELFFPAGQRGCLTPRPSWGPVVAALPHATRELKRMGAGRVMVEPPYGTVPPASPPATPDPVAPAIAVTLAKGLCFSPLPQAPNRHAAQTFSVFFVGTRGVGFAARDSCVPDRGVGLGVCVPGCRRQRPSPALS